MSIKHLLYCHQYFKKPTDTGGTRSFYIAHAMVKAGFSVTIVTSDTNPSGGSLIRREDMDGINIIWISAPYHNGMGVPRKLLAFFKYMLVSSYVVMRTKSYDLIYATSTPLTVGIPALVASFLRRKPYVFEVRDLWPEFPIQIGAFKSPLIIWMTRKLEATIYSRAEAIVALSPGMREGVLKVNPHAVTHMIPNMSKPKEFRVEEVSEEDRSYFGLNENSKIRAIYFGTMGRANNIMHLVREAKYARDNGIEFELILVGSGAMESVAGAYVEDHGLDNVVFLGRRPMQEVAKIVALCDLSLISFSDEPILQTNSPNKFFDSLSASKPCIVNVSGWIRELVEHHDCGEYADPDILGDLANIIERYKQSPRTVERQGANAYALCLQKFDREKLCREVVEVVKGVDGSV